MFQDIIVLLIITAAIGYTLYSTVRSLTRKNRNVCDGCAGCEVRQEVLKNIKTRKQAEEFTCASRREITNKPIIRNTGNTGKHKFVHNINRS